MAAVSGWSGRPYWRGWLGRSMMPVFIALTAALIALALVIAQTIVAQREARVDAMIEGDTLLTLHEIMRTMLDAETGQRGYVLTTEENYLEPYTAAHTRIEPLLERLRLIAGRSDNLARNERIARLERLIASKFAEMDQTVKLAEAGRRDDAIALVRSNFGKRQMDGLRIEIARQSSEGARLRGAGFARADALEQRLLPLIAVLGVAILALVVSGFRAERKRAETAARADQADALHEANERTQLLARELNHRVKNLFSVILSIVTLSGRKPGSSREVVDSIRARIHALSLAHSASQGGAGDNEVSLTAIVEKTLGPYRDADSLRVRIGGPEVLLPVRMMTPVGLILHELATNAVKYGGLSTPDGMVDISWELAGSAADEVRLRWIESGGPALSESPPTETSAGFGTQMTSLAARQLGGSIERRWPPTGLIVDLAFPLPKG